MLCACGFLVLLLRALVAELRRLWDEREREREMGDSINKWRWNRDYEKDMETAKRDWVMC